MSESVGLRSSDGLALEAEIDEPVSPKAAFVLCHPHPKMGGTMNAPLLLALTDALTGRGWAVLRFNFRGIGASEGQAGTGESETADAAGAVAFARLRWPRVPVAIAGWSFGAAVAVRVAARDPELLACVAIAPAVKPKPEVTAGLPDPDSLELDVPTLFVCAENDELVDAAACAQWVETARADIVTLKGANHFFWGKYDDLAEAVVGFLDELT